MMTKVYAGAAKCTITPDLTQGPVFLAGFQANRSATSVHDDLYARALAIRVENGDTNPAQPTCFCLVVCDLIGLCAWDVSLIRQAAQEQGIDARGLVVASTHTHSGPDTIGLWGRSRFRSGVDPRCQAFIREQVVKAAAEAVSHLQAAELRVGRTDMPRWLKNGRQPHIVDRELSVLQATTSEGSPVFTLVNLACHPEVMFGENQAISADFAGAACQTIEKQQGGIGVLASADLGGMMTPDVGDRERTFETVQRMGEDVAAVAWSALEKGERLKPPAMRFRRRQAHIPLHNPLFKFARAIGVLPSVPLDRQGRVSTQVSMFDLGAMRLVTVPGELLPGPGIHLRGMLNVPYRFLVGLADDELGYLIPADEFVYPRNPFRPGAHYEETMSLSRDALPLLMEAWAALMADEG